MVLKDHKRSGKKFIPPMIYKMNIGEVRYVEWILPQIIWIGFIAKFMGAREGFLAASEMITVAQDLCTEDDKPGFAFMSSFQRLSESHTDCVISCSQPHLAAEVSTFFCW